MHFAVRAVSFLAILLTVGFFIFGGYMYSEFNSRGELKEDRVLIIPKGLGLNGIASLLNDNEVIKSKYPFILGAKILGLSGRLKAGEYKFSENVPPVSVLKTLATGRTMIRYITIPEGLTSKEIVDC